MKKLFLFLLLLPATVFSATTDEKAASFAIEVFNLFGAGGTLLIFMILISVLGVLKMIKFKDIKQLGLAFVYMVLFISFVVLIYNYQGLEMSTDGKAICVNNDFIANNCSSSSGWTQK